MNLYLLKINIRDNRTISMKMSVMFVIFLTLSSFHVTGLFLYSLKTLENISLVLWCFRGYRKRPVAWNGLEWFLPGNRIVGYKKHCDLHSETNLILHTKIFTLSDENLFRILQQEFAKLLRGFAKLLRGLPHYF